MSIDINPTYQLLGMPLPTTVTVDFVDLSSNQSITTATYQVANLPVTISAVNIIATNPYQFQIVDSNGCSDNVYVNMQCVGATPSWDCANGACIDPGNGLGQYSSLSACQAACGVVSFACDPTSICPGETINIDNYFHLFLETHLPPVPGSGGVAVTVNGGTPGAMGNGNPSDGTICNFPACTVTELDLSNGVTGQPAPPPLFGSGGDLLNPGLEAFVDLEILKVDSQELTSRDVSNNLALINLSCGENQLTTLDVSGNTALTNLYCSNDLLTSLDVTQNTALIALHFQINQLTNIDLSQNTALEYLVCNSNQLTSLDVSNNTALGYLACNYNNITDIYLGDTINLSNLELHTINASPGNTPLVIHVGSSARVLIAQSIPISIMWDIDPGTTFSPL